VWSGIRNEEVNSFGVFEFWIGFDAVLDLLDI
jgi:hypothetical protein